MTNILLITSSPRSAEGLSSRFAAEIAERLKAQSGATLTARDLSAEPLPHITPAYINGRMTSPEARTPEQATRPTISLLLIPLRSTAISICRTTTARLSR